MTRRRAVRLAGVALFAAFALYSTFRVPRDPLRVYRAVPAAADFVSVHFRPADRLEDWFDTPAAGLIAQSFGIAPDDWESFCTAEATRAWARRLADQKAVFASYLSNDGRRVWLFASDLGARALRLHWMLKAGALPAFRKSGTYGGRTLWMLSGGDGLPLWIAFEEGVLIGCWSDRPGEIRNLLDTYDRVRPSIMASGLAPQLERRNADAPDRIWWNGAATEIGPVWADIFSASAAGIRGRVELPAGRGRLPRPARDVASDDAAALLGSTPSITLAADADWLIGLAGALNPPPVLTLALAYLRGEISSPAAMGVFGGAYGGRLFRMKVPGLALAVPLRRPAEATAILRERVDRINAGAGTAIALGPIPDPEGALFSISAPDIPLYSGLPTAEQAALALRAGRLYAASNLDTLRAMLAAMPSRAPTESSAAERAAAFLRADLRAGGSAVRDGISVYALALMMQNREGTRALRAELHRIREFLERIEPLARIEAALRFDAAETPIVDFTIGAAEGTP